MSKQENNSTGNAYRKESLLDNEDLAILQPLPQGDRNENPFYKFVSSDKFFNFVVFVLVSITIFLIFYPIYLVFIAAISDPYAVSNGEVILWPSGFNSEGFARIARDARLPRSFMNSVIITTGGTLISLLGTIPTAYVISVKDFKLRNFMMVVIMITIYVSGGMIPEFLLMQDLGLLNSWWALILPGAVSSWNLIISRIYFQMNTSGELMDAAKIDGANHWQYFTKVAVPLSSTLIVIMALFYGVGYWNAFAGAMIYIFDTELYPFQLVIRDILINQQIAAESLRTSGDADGNTIARLNEIAMSIKYVVAVIACLPIIIVFPFVEKYFVKGIMIGSVKG